MINQTNEVNFTIDIENNIKLKSDTNYTITSNPPNHHTYNLSKITSLTNLMLICGIISGILGIGGGLIIGPMLLNLLKLRPEVQSATTNILVFCSSLSGLLFMITMGKVHWDWAIVLGLISLSCAIVSKYVFEIIAKQ